mmetsp:Transcript_9722/g.24021  ORF Transcript_9722/g.24021 Transcript_9722/m.24021 type:complete len:210 (+) Transcript_9722:869-1498(+)
MGRPPPTPPSLPLSAEPFSDRVSGALRSEFAFSHVGERPRPLPSLPHLSPAPLPAPLPSPSPLPPPLKLPLPSPLPSGSVSPGSAPSLPSPPLPPPSRVGELSMVDSPHPRRRLRYRRYFCRWLATFSRDRPSTFISCMMVLGTALLLPRCDTASTKRLCSGGVQTSRGRFVACALSSSTPSIPPRLAEGSSRDRLNASKLRECSTPAW